MALLQYYQLEPEQASRRLHAGGVQKVPFLLESKLKEEGAQYTKGQDWHSYAVFDGKLITGASNDLHVPSLMLPLSAQLTMRSYSWQ